MTLNAMPFAQPLRVKLQGGLERIFLTVYDALDFLENEWPLRSGAAYERAIAVCRHALEGRANGRAARVALISACREAGVTPLGMPRGLYSGGRAAA